MESIPLNLPRCIWNVCLGALQVMVSSECAGSSDCISGQRTAIAANGSVVFNSIRANTPPGIYSLTFSAMGLEPVIIPFSIRDCRPGEVNLTMRLEAVSDGELSANQFICSNCSSGKFSFLPTVDCQSCSDHAICTGGSVMVPKDGYWHSSPFSIQFHKCLVKTACMYEMAVPGLTGKRDRSTFLIDFYAGLSLAGVMETSENHALFSNEDYSQCTKVSFALTAWTVTWCHMSSTLPQYLWAWLPSSSCSVELSICIHNLRYIREGAVLQEVMFWDCNETTSNFSGPNSRCWLVGQK